MNELINEVFDKIDELAKKHIDMLLDICNIESQTIDKEGVDKVGDYLAAVAEKTGYKIKKKEFERAGNVYSFSMNEESEGELICLSGHMDTVHEKGFFGYPAAKIEGEYITGPGTLDCKGGIVVAMLAMEALKACGYNKRQIKLILQSDEEVNSNLSDMGTVDFMVEEAKGSLAFLNLEGYGQGRITVTRKGITKKEITIKGRSVHASACIYGVSAIKEAAYKILEFEKENGNDSGITFNCGVINGGTVINVVPSECTLMIEYRFRTMEEKKRAEERFWKIVNTSYIEGTVSTAKELSSRAPMERTVVNENLANRISDISEMIGFGKLELWESAGGADSAYTTLAGIPTVDSLGIQGERCHSIDEKVRISSIAERAKLIAAAIMEL